MLNAKLSLQLSLSCLSSVDYLVATATQEFPTALLRSTCSSPGAEGSGMRGGVHTPKHGHPLTDGRVEVVVVGNGSGPKAGVVLGGGVGAIAVPRVLSDTVLSLVRQFGRFFVLTLYTAHYLRLLGRERHRIHFTSYTLHMVNAQRHRNVIITFVCQQVYHIPGSHLYKHTQTQTHTQRHTYLTILLS